MLHLVCYDIADDRRRDVLSRGLLNFGVRIQESVFECLLDRKMLDRMMEWFGHLTIGNGDKIRVYRVCSDCVNQVVILGKGEVTRDPDFYVV